MALAEARRADLGKDGDDVPGSEKGTTGLGLGKGGNGTDETERKDSQDGEVPLLRVRCAAVCARVFPSDLALAFQDEDNDDDDDDDDDDDNKDRSRGGGRRKRRRRKRRRRRRRGAASRPQLGLRLCDGTASVDAFVSPSFFPGISPSRIAEGGSAGRAELVTLQRTLDALQVGEFATFAASTPF